jgi:hypothetical protein
MATSSAISKDNDRLADGLRINAGDIRINLATDLLLADLLTK